MVHVWLLRWPKRRGSTTGNGCDTGAGNAVAADTAGATGSLSGDTAVSIDCCGLAKLIGKLKKRKRRPRLTQQGQQRRLTTSRQSSFQCRYDPLSYSLNFDARGSGSLEDDDDDYYQFHTFSSRFAANPIGSRSQCPSR